jgi:glycosyltransferase involved in cell wall biosynthesis
VRVSGVIPVRDRAALVGRAIDSALAQQSVAFELIVVDDGSKDATPAVLAGYGERIVAVSQPPTGRSAARNAGIARARGEWIAFLDSDDAWLPDKLARQLAHHDAHPELAMSAHGLEKVFPDGRTRRSWLTPRLGQLYSKHCELRSVSSVCFRVTVRLALFCGLILFLAVNMKLYSARPKRLPVLVRRSQLRLLPMTRCWLCLMLLRPRKRWHVLSHAIHDCV